MGLWEAPIAFYSLLKKKERKKEILALIAQGYFELYEISFPGDKTPKVNNTSFFPPQVKHKLFQDLTHYFSHQLMHNCL